MKNKGFTLVELIAVIVVLGIIGLIAIPTVTTLINQSKERAKNTQIKEIVRTAESWAANNIDKLSTSETYYLDVQILVNEGYVDIEDIKDPTDSSKYLNECVAITYSTKYSNYQFEYTSCTSSEDTPE